MKYLVRILIMICFSCHLTIIHAQVVINEVQSNNASTLIDEEGDYNDWLEIYNKGAESVNLQAFGLSDEVQNPFKWRFGNQLIGPGEYITVMASGKNKYYQELSPDSLPELVAWFSASTVNINDPLQVEKSGDQWVVKRWNSSKNNYVASQTNLSNSPVLVLDSIGKQRALRFNGTSHFF